MKRRTYLSICFIIIIMAHFLIGCRDFTGNWETVAENPVITPPSNTIANIAVKIDESVVGAVSADNLDLWGDSASSTKNGNIAGKLDSTLATKYGLIASYFNAFLKNKDDQQIGEPVSIDFHGLCFFKNVPTQNDLRVEVVHKNQFQNLGTSTAKLTLVTYIGEIPANVDITKEIVITCKTMAIAQIMNEGKSIYGASFTLELASKALNTIDTISQNILKTISEIIPDGSNLEKIIKIEVSFTNIVQTIVQLPVISNIHTESLTNSSAFLDFSVSQALPATIEYGLTTDYEITNDNPVATASAKTDHQFQISGLLSGVTYHYRAVVYTSAEKIVSPDKIFVTQSKVDATPLTISNLVANPISDGEVIISWNASKMAYGYLEYGLSSDYGLSTNSAILQASFSFDLANLISGQRLYHYRVTTTDTNGNKYVSPDQTFTLKETTAPDITGPIVVEVVATSTTNSGIISFITDEPAEASITYVPGSFSALSQDLKTIAGPLNFTLSHSITIPGLNQLSSYSYQISSVDKLGNFSKTSVYSFSTLPDNTPVIISNVKIQQNSTFLLNHFVTLQWETNQDCQCTVSYGIGSDRSLTASETVIGQKHSLDLKTAATDSNYGFSIRAINDITGSDSSYNGVFKTPKIEVKDLNISFNPEGTAATFTFSTGDPCRIRIRYGVNSVSENTTLESSASSTSQIASLTRLPPYTTYNYEILCMDDLGNECLSNSGTFKTPRIEVTQLNIGTGIEGTTASFTYSTSTLAKTSLHYWVNLNSVITKTASDVFEIPHSLFFNNLTPQTTYNYDILCKDSSGNEYVSKSGTFVTPLQVIPFGMQIEKMSALMLIRIGLTDSNYSPTVSFDTNQGAKTFIKSDPLSDPKINQIVLAYNNTDLFILKPFSSMSLSVPLPSGATAEIFDPNVNSSIVKVTVP
ncbi:MAG: hypothetical protein HQM08_16905 [Candidatus Riflebacteria bacterium]|nr:hypothetical protein [Candidatus Riflebacteria bacterium]